MENQSSDRLIKLTLVPDALSRMGYEKTVYHAVWYQADRNLIPTKEVGGKTMVDRADLENIAYTMRLRRRKTPALISQAELAGFLSLYGSGGDADRYVEHALTDVRHPHCFPHAILDGKTVFDADTVLLTHSILRVAEPSGAWSGVDEDLSDAALKAKAEALAQIDKLRAGSRSYLERSGFTVFPAIEVQEEAA